MKLLSAAVLLVTATSAGAAEQRIEPLFVCQSPVGHIRLEKGIKSGWAEEAYTGTVVVVKRGVTYDVLTMNGDKLTESIVDQGAKVLDYGMGAAGGVLVGMWPDGSDVRTYRVMPKVGGVYGLYMTTSRHGAQTTSVDKVGAYSADCVVAAAPSPPATGGSQGRKR